MDKANKLIRCKAAAGILDVSTSAVRLIEERGLLHAVRDWSGHRRFKETEVRELRRRLLSGEFKAGPAGGAAA